VGPGRSAGDPVSAADGDVAAAGAEPGRLDRTFALWGEAVARGLGRERGSFMAAYERSRHEATETALESSPLGSMLLKLAPTILNWECSPTELFEMLTTKVGRRVAGSAAWPKSTQRFMSELRRLSPQLRMHGLSTVFSRTYQGRRVALVTAGFIAEVTGDGDLGDAEAAI
jgi:hypothetical protein